MKNSKLLFTALFFVITALSISLFAQTSDGDGDGIKDADDLCPATKGTVANKGCPEKTKTAPQTTNSKNVGSSGQSSISEADLLKMQISAMDEIEAKLKNYKKLFAEYRSDSTSKQKKDNLDLRKSEMMEVNRIANHIISNFSEQLPAKSKTYFSAKALESENNLKIINLQIGLIASDQEDSTLSEGFLDKVLNEPKPQVQAETKKQIAVKTAKELNPNNEGEELFYAIKYRKDSLAESLIKSGMNLHYVERNGDSTLSMTIREGLNNYTKKLLEMGADPNFVGDNQHNPLARAVFQGNLEIVKLLVDKYKADLNLIKFNWSILHYAATYNRNGEITKFLLAAGANPNFSIDGQTPLSIALQNRNSSETISLLTEASNKQIKGEAEKRDATIGNELRQKDAKILAERESEKEATQAAQMGGAQQRALQRQGYQYVASGTTTLQGRSFNDKNQAVKQNISVGYDYIFLIVTDKEINFVVTIGDDGKFTSSNNISEGFGKEKIPNSDLTAYYFKFGYDDKSGYIYFIPHGESWADVRWVLMRKKL